jgi:hypothetical protein
MDEVKAATPAVEVLNISKWTFKWSIDKVKPATLAVEVN